MKGDIKRDYAFLQRPFLLLAKDGLEDRFVIANLLFLIAQANPTRPSTRNDILTYNFYISNKIFDTKTKIKVIHLLIAFTTHLTSLYLL